MVVRLACCDVFRRIKKTAKNKLLINTINAHSYNTARKDSLFAEALTNGDVLIPDGVSIVKACKWIKAKSQPKERIAGWDLFFFEMNKLEKKGGTVMFMGSSQKVLDLIVKRAPIWWQEYGLEWLYRLIKEPKRMWRRYIVPLEHGERGVGGSKIILQ